MNLSFQGLPALQKRFWKNKQTHFSNLFDHSVDGPTCLIKTHVHRLYTCSLDTVSGWFVLHEPRSSLDVPGAVQGNHTITIPPETNSAQCFMMCPDPDIYRVDGKAQC